MTRISIKTLFLLAFFIVAAGCAKAALNGTINVPNATYPTLDSVIKALNVQGVGAGGVIINLVAGNPQTAPAGGYKLGSTALNATTANSRQITINGNNNIITAFTGTGSTDAIFSITGTDYVNINALQLQEAAANNTTAKQMEWGFSFVKLNNTSPFDGCQNNKINGCTISLNISNTATIGIRLAHTIYNSATVIGTAGTAADRNSNNTFTANTISGCITAFSATGIANANRYDLNNAFGGATPATGNTVIIGGSSTTAYGVKTANADAFSILNNNFSFASGHTGIGYMIYTGTGKGDLDILNNSFNVSCSTTTNAIYALYNYNISSAGHQDGTANFVFAGNTITGSNTAATSGSLYGMYNYYSNFLADSIYNNTISNLTWGAASSTASLYLLYNYYGNTPTVFMDGNTIKNVTKNGGTSGTTYGCYIDNNPATTGQVTLTDNVMQNVTANYHVYAMYAAAGFISTPAPNAGQLLIHKNNKVDKVVVSNAGSLYGQYAYNGTLDGELAFDTVSNCKVATGTLYGIFQGMASGNLHDNLIINDTAATGTVYGLYHDAGTSNIYNNRIDNLTLTGASGGIYGMNFSTVATQANIYNNSISDFNLISYSGSTLYGMYLSATASYNVFHNTIRLSPTTTGTNRGAAGVYYASGVTNLDLRNNIINVNLTPAGTGIVAALVRSSGTAGTAPANFANTSSGNIYYVPAATNAFFYAETYSTSAINKYNLSNDPNFNTPCGAYKSFMAPRDAFSFTENNLSPVGSSVLYAPAGSSIAKGAAVPTTAPAITSDINNIARTIPADAGALQFSGTANDIVPPVIIHTPVTKSYCTSNPVITATIEDISGVNTTTNPPRIYYRKSSESDNFGNYPANNVSSFNGWKYVTATNNGSLFSFTLDYSKLTSPVTVNDNIVYFIVAQDNAATPNVGSSIVGYNTGYCPASVNVLPAAGPTKATPAKNNFTILAAPALPTVAPATSTICQGSFKKLTATPPSNVVTATIGTGTTTNTTSSYPTPFGQFYGASHEQYLIRATELSAQGLSAGPITSLAFNLFTGYSYAALSNYSIKMANTAVSAMSTSLITTGFTTVYSVTSYMPPSVAGWAPVNFTTPFMWDGVSNVVVDVSWLNCTTCNGTSNCTTTYTNNGRVYQSSTSYVSTLNFYYDDNCTINTFAPSGSYNSNTYSQRPNMQFVGGTPFNINWTPVAGLFKDSALTQPVSATDTNSVVYASPATTTSYHATTMLGGCNSNTSSPAVVNVNVTPTTTTPANTASFCGGSSATINGPSGTGLTYQWMQNGSNISGATSQNYTATATGNYGLKVTNTVTGCVATSAPIVVSNTPPPAASVTAAGPTTVCSGSTVAMNASSGAAYTYQWTRNGIPLNGATNIGYTATSTGNYGVIVSVAANCSNTSSNIGVLVDTVNIAITPAGSPSVCAGGSVTLNGTTAPNRTYQWQVGNGSSWLNILGATNSGYVATSSGNYAVTATNTATGCSATSPAIAVAVGPGPAAGFTPAGSVTLCQGNTTSLSITPYSNCSYQWKLNGSPISGATNNTYVAGIAGNYTLTVSISPSCQNTSSPTTVIVNPTPNVTTTPAGPNAAVCQNSTLNISVPSGSGYTYQWKQGATNINGATGNNYNVTNAGNYTVTVTNTATNCVATSANLNISVVTPPVATASATGPLTICDGDTTALAANTGTGYSYQWRLNGQNIAGATSPGYNAYQQGSYSVIVAISSCGTTSAPVSLTVNPTPAALIDYTAALEFCEGGAVVFNGTPGANLSYQWVMDGAPIAGATNKHNIVNATGNYRLTVTNSYGCSATSAPESVIVHALPNPIISKSGDDLITGNYSSYQWHIDGNPIAGAVAQKHTPAKEGGYHVTVVDNFGCQNRSPIVFINSLGVRSISGNDAGIRVYPNPTQAIIHIDAPMKVNVTILDATGRTIISKEHAAVIDLGQIASGTYMVIVADENGEVLKTEKIIKSE